MINRFAQMRDSWFTKIILTVTALSFVSLFGVSGYINSAARNKAVIQVDDIQISQSEFSYLLQRELTRMRALLGNYADEEDSDELKSKIAHMLANTKLNDAILENTMRKYKVDFTPNLIGNIIAMMPEFNNNGKFDQQLYNAYLKNSNKTESEFVNEVKLNVARKLLVEMPIIGAKVPAIEQQQMQKVLGQRRTFKYLKIKNSDSLIDRKPTAEELDRLYEEMAEELMIPEKRDITVMYLSQDAIEKTIEVTPQEVSAYYKEHIDQYEQPEQRNVLQMVFEDEDTANAVAKELQSGADFITVAAANGQKPDEINLGYVSQNDVSEELAEVIFSLAKNAVSAPFSIGDSWQIVKVTDIKAATKPDMEKINQEIIAEIRQEKAYDGSYELLTSIEDKIGAGTQLSEIAAAYNTPLLPVIGLDEDGKADSVNPSLQDVIANRDFIDTAFSYNEGEVSQVVETDEGLAVIMVDKIHDEHQQPREEAEAKLQKMWAENERAAITAEKIENIRNDAEAGDDLPTIAKRYGLSTINSRPLLRSETIDKLTLADMKTLFAAVPEEPIIIETGEDYVVAATTKIYDDSASLSAIQKDQLQQVLGNNLLAAMSEALLKDFAAKYTVKVEYGRMGLSD